MQYRRFGRLDWKVSALGFGCMRLPTLGSASEIDEPEATRMIRWAIDQGVNYLDTAYGYHGGNSERVLGRILKDGYREKVRVATKMPSWLVSSTTDFDCYLDEQLQKLQLDTIDYYLLHGLDSKNWPRVREAGICDWLDGQVAAGRIRHTGFSFHDNFEVFQEVVEGYDWTLCQVQYNYLDVDHQAGVRGVRYAASKGLAVVVMEPVRGGRLANLPEGAQTLLDAAPSRRAPTDWALQWVWNQPEVSVALSGMSTMEQVEQNVASADVSGPGMLAAAELELLARVREEVMTWFPIPCTECWYCMQCPQGVDIPRNHRMFNEGVISGRLEGVRHGYRGMPEERKASACVACRECEAKCPQHIPISEWMVVIHEVLGEGKPYRGVRE